MERTTEKTQDEIALAACGRRVHGQVHGHMYDRSQLIHMINNP